MTRLAIIDDNGIIEEGPWDEVATTWDQWRTQGAPADLEWSGDLVLVEVKDRMA